MVGSPLRWLGGKIDIRVEVETLAEGGATWDESSPGWDEATWALFDWSDITEYVQDLRISRGQPRWESRFKAGSLTLKLNNISGLFTPEGGSQLQGIPFRPGRLVRVIVNPDPTDPDTWVPLFTGRIDDSTDTYIALAQDVVATVRALDAFADLHGFNPPMLETATGVQSTHARVGAALDRMDWPSELRDIDTGEHTMQTSHLAQTVLEEVQRAAEAEGGTVYADVDGTIVFKSRDWLISDVRTTTPQGYLGFEAHEVPEGVPYASLTDIKVNWETARIRNDIQFARAGSTAYRAEDTDSQVLFGRRTHQRFDFQNNTDEQVEFLADRHLAAYKDLRYQVVSATIAANQDPDNEDLNRLFYDAQFGDKLALKVDTSRGWSYQKLPRIIGIDHHITPDDWTVTFTLDDSAIGQAGAGLVVAWPDSAASIPEGWVRVFDLDGRYPKGSQSEPGALGGSLTHIHTTSGHAHTLGSHTHAGATILAAVGTIQTAFYSGSTTSRHTTDHTHTASSTDSSGTFSSQSSSPGLLAASNDVSRKEMIFIQLTEEYTTFPNGVVCYNSEVAAPTGWSDETAGISNGDFGYLKGATGGGSTTFTAVTSHTHEIEAHTHAGTSHGHSSFSSSSGTTSVTGLSLHGGGSITRFNSTNHSHPLTIANATSASLNSASGGTSGAGTANQLDSVTVGLIRKTSGSDPDGIIAIWLGAISSIPVGWVWCNGTNGTPDLRQRYPEFRRDSGAWEVGGTYNSSAHNHSGGSHTHTTSGHTHAVTVGQSTGATTSDALLSDDHLTSPTHTHAASSTGSTTPSVSSSSVGTSSSVNSEPPFMEVLFIMKQTP